MKLLDVDDLRTGLATTAEAVHAVDGRLSVDVGETPAIVDKGSRGRLRRLGPWCTR